MSKETWKQRYEEVEPVLKTKRFHLSREPILRDRLRIIQEEFEAFQEKHPGALGLSIFGSMSKGYADKESDVDVILFVDEKHSEGTSWVDFSERLRKAIGDSFEVSFQVVFTGMASLDANLDGAEKEFEALVEAQKARGETLSEIPEKPMLSFPCGELTRFFTGISVGGSLDVYRRHVLTRLRDMGEVGELIWKRIIRGARLFERPVVKHDVRDIGILKGKYKDLYPQTIDDAIKYFVDHKSFRKKKNADESAS